MTVLAAIVLWTLGLVAGLLALLLLMPFGARAVGELDTCSDDPADLADGELTLWWGLGLLAVRLRTRGRSGLDVLGLRVKRLDLSRPGDDRDATPDDDRETRRTPRERGALWAYTHRHTLLDLLRRALGLLHLRGCVEGVVGLSDPADTATLKIVKDLLGAIRERLTSLAGGNAVVAQPISIADRHVVPLCELGVGLAAGGGKGEGTASDGSPIPNPRQG